MIYTTSPYGAVTAYNYNWIQWSTGPNCPHYFMDGKDGKAQASAPADHIVSFVKPVVWNTPTPNAVKIDVTPEMALSIVACNIKGYGAARWSATGKHLATIKNALRSLDLRGGEWK